MAIKDILLPLVGEPSPAAIAAIEMVSLRRKLLDDGSGSEGV